MSEKHLSVEKKINSLISLYKKNLLDEALAEAKIYLVNILIILQFIILWYY